ncbi:hypothetical protein PybrP1_012165 [[Pythium] brassicae (nom. inval.)]|nr:hypothetical protein PybrP1_012165 [[Pythium] brassicae (nom. inval.)]
MAPSSSASTALVVAPSAAPSAAAVAAAPHHDADDDVDLPVDLSQLPRIPPAKTLLLVTNFVANTTRFLNHFAGDCEARLARVSTGLTRVEILLAILEAKLDSIPDLTVSDAQVDAAARSITGDAPLPAGGNAGDAPSLGIDSQDLPDAGGVGFVPPPPPPPPGAPLEGDGGAETRLVVGGLPPPPPPPPPPGLPSFDGDGAELSSALVLAPYFTMRRLGIPDPVIEQKLMLDGMDPRILRMDPDGPSPSGGSVSSSAELPPPPPPPTGPPQPPSGNIGLPFPPPPPPISPTSSTSSRAESLFSGPTHPPPPPPSLFPATGPPLPPMPDQADESSSDDDEEIEVDAPPAQPGVLKLKDDPAFAKYFTMRKLGMPDGVIQHKLMMDGVTLDILSMDPEGPSPNAGTGAASAAPPSSGGGPLGLPPPPPQGLPPPPAGRPGLPPPPMPKYDDDDDDFDSDSDSD